jgi:hypothetical protein
MCPPRGADSQYDKPERFSIGILIAFRIGEKPEGDRKPWATRINAGGADSEIIYALSSLKLIRAYVGFVRFGQRGHVSSSYCSTV